MRYFALYDENNNLIAIGIGNQGNEIAYAEYIKLQEEISLKNDYTNQLYSNEITINEIPESFQEEIQKRVDKLILQFGKYEDQEINSMQTMNIILGR